MQTQMDLGNMTFEHHLNKLVGDGKVDKQLANTFLGKKERKLETVTSGTQSSVKVQGIAKDSGLKITGVAENTQSAAAGFFKRKG